MVAKECSESGSVIERDSGIDKRNGSREEADERKKRFCGSIQIMPWAFIFVLRSLGRKNLNVMEIGGRRERHKGRGRRINELYGGFEAVKSIL